MTINLLSLAKSNFNRPDFPIYEENPTAALEKAILNSNNAAELFDLQRYLKSIRHTLSPEVALLSTKVRHVTAAHIGTFSSKKVFADCHLGLISKAVPLLFEKLQKQDPKILQEPSLYGPKRIESVKILFDLCESLGLTQFQREHLEPFNIKFPNIPLYAAPLTIIKLCFDGARRVSLDLISLEEFPNLEELSFYRACDEVVEAIADFSPKTKERIKTLSLSSNNSNLVNLAEFPNLEVINILNVNTQEVQTQYLD
jgi:hypothetical protein